jgi:chemotaxis protein MotB
MKVTARPTRAGHDRWLVSYADLVTLLFAFFTTLYAASAVNATSTSEAMTRDGDVSHSGPHPDATGSVAPVPSAPPAAAVAPATDELLGRLSATLEDDVRLQRADIVRDGRGVVVSLPERATFSVGSAEVTREARPLIAKVVGELNRDSYALRIEGHTDDVPIRTARYPSNWELSTARAGAVVAYLINDLQFPADRLSAAGYAEFHPRVPNDTVENRARNRRIDIVVLPLEVGSGQQAAGSTDARLLSESRVVPFEAEAR